MNDYFKLIHVVFSRLSIKLTDLLDSSLYQINASTQHITLRQSHHLPPCESIGLLTLRNTTSPILHPNLHHHLPSNYTSSSSLISTHPFCYCSPLTNSHFTSSTHSGAYKRLIKIQYSLNYLTSFRSIQNHAIIYFRVLKLNKMICFCVYILIRTIFKGKEEKTN